MNDLITALQIFLKYANNIEYPTHCGHDCLYIHRAIKLNQVDSEDLKKLEELGFFWSEEDDCFISFRFGSC